MEEKKYPSLTVGVYIFYTGWQHLGGEKESLVKEATKSVSSYAKLLIIIGGSFEIIIGLSLIAGYLTQLMALLGIIYIATLLWFKRTCPIYVKHERVFYVMIFVILLSLLFTGAGAPAVDLPL